MWIYFNSNTLHNLCNCAEVLPRRPVVQTPAVETRDAVFHISSYSQLVIPKVLYCIFTFWSLCKLIFSFSAVWWLSGRALYLFTEGCRFKPHIRNVILYNKKWTHWSWRPLKRCNSSVQQCSSVCTVQLNFASLRPLGAILFNYFKISFLNEDGRSSMFVWGYLMFSQHLQHRLHVPQCPLSIRPSVVTAFWGGAWHIEMKFSLMTPLRVIIG